MNFLLAFLLPAQVPQELSQYVHKADSSFKWKQENESDGSSQENGENTGELRFDLTSQTWNGIQWKHTVVWSNTPHGSYRLPVVGKLTHTAIVYITGDNPDSADIQDAESLAKMSGLPVATLFNMPNQPLFGLSEDDLIAETFKQFLQTGNANQILLFPMAKATIRTMDMIEQATRHKINRFIVFGISKRGWTSWMAAAAGDKRIVGIAPTSFEMLNIEAQLKHQKGLWSEFSPMFAPYAKLGLLKGNAGERYKKLVRIIDPYSYLSRIRIPVFDVRGTNDPFWTPDAFNYFAKKLPTSQWSLCMPNEGHDFKDKQTYFQNIAAFARMCGNRTLWPHVWAKVEKNKVVVHCSERPEEVRVLEAESNSGHLEKKNWSKIGIASPSIRVGVRIYSLNLPKPTKRWQGWLVNTDFIVLESGVPMHITLSCPVQIREGS